MKRTNVLALGALLGAAPVYAQTLNLNPQTGTGKSQDGGVEVRVGLGNGKNRINGSSTTESRLNNGKLSLVYRAPQKNGDAFKAPLFSAGIACEAMTSTQLDNDMAKLPYNRVVGAAQLLFNLNDASSSNKRMLHIGFKAALSREVQGFGKSRDRYDLKGVTVTAPGEVVVLSDQTLDFLRPFDLTFTPAPTDLNNPTTTPPGLTITQFDSEAFKKMRKRAADLVVKFLATWTEIDSERIEISFDGELGAGFTEIFIDGQDATEDILNTIRSFGTSAFNRPANMDQAQYDQMNNMITQHPDQVSYTLDYSSNVGKSQYWRLLAKVSGELSYKFGKDLQTSPVVKAFFTLGYEGGNKDLNGLGKVFKYCLGVELQSGEFTIRGLEGTKSRLFINATWRGSKTNIGSGNTVDATRNGVRAGIITNF